jgi:hypothetical protein
VLPLSEVVPLTVNDPPTLVALLELPMAVVVEPEVFMLVIPLTVVEPVRVEFPVWVRVPLSVSPPLVVAKPVTPKVPLSVVGPVTARLELKLAEPVTANVPVKLALDEMVWPLTVPDVTVPVPRLRLALLVTMPPLAVSCPVRVEAPVTAKLPPKVVAPVPTLKLEVPLTARLPLKFLAPAKV